MVGKGPEHSKNICLLSLLLPHNPFLLYPFKVVFTTFNFFLQNISQRLPSFPFLFCCHYPSPDHQQHVAMSGLHSCARGFTDFENLAQPPHLA